MNDMVNRFVEYWDLAEKYIVGILSTVAVFISLYGVVMRYGFHSAPYWVEEVVVYIFIVTIFIMGSTLVKVDGHVSVDFVLLRLPPKAQRILLIVGSVLSMAFCVMTIYYGIKVCITSIQMNEFSNTELRFPLWVIYTAIPSGCFLMTVRYFLKLHHLFFQSGDEKKVKAIAGTM